MATPSEGSVEAKGTPREREPQTGRREGARSAGPDETEQLIFTLRPASGEVVRIERVDAAGKRSDLAPDDAAALTGKQGLDDIEAALDEAFEVGIFSVLDPGGRDEGPDESRDEIDLRRLLLRLIIGRDARRRLQQRIAQRLVLTRTMSH